MAIQTLKKIDVTTEDFGFKNFYLSEVNEIDRSRDQKENLILVKFIGSKKMSVTPGLFYFGELSKAELENLRGSKVDFILKPGGKGFSVDHIQPIN